MKRTILFSAIVILISATGILPAYSRIVRNPSFETRKSSVVTIEEIDLGKDATRVKFHAVFRPNWWISVDSTECITDAATDQEFYPIGSEGITLGEKYWMPKSGDTTFTVIYPPLPDDVSVINFAPDGNWATFGIRLDGKEIKCDSNTAIPAIVSRKHVDRPSFFSNGNVRLHGAIANYDPRLEIESMALYLDDLAIGDSFVKSIAIKPDGTFDETFEITSPQTVSLNINRNLMKLYLEPDNDLQLIVDWEKILEMDRMRGLLTRIDGVEFGGSLADINRTLHYAPDYGFSDMYSAAKSTDPMTVKTQIETRASAWREDMKRYAADNNIAPEHLPYLQRRIDASRYGDMLDYVMYRLYVRQSEAENETYQTPIPKEYYASFLPDLLKADTLLLGAYNMSIVLNRLGFETMEDVLDLQIDPTSRKDYYESEDMAKAVAEYADTDSVPFMWQIAMGARNGKSIKRYARWNKDNIRKSLDNLLASTVKDEYITRRLNELYDTTVNYTTSPLPDTDAGRLMSKLLAPYKGKWVIADFWGTTCGPCRANIERTKQFRDANRDNDHFTYLFITGSDESPKGAYDEYVAANLTNDNCRYLSSDEIIGLRDLFGITGIPHYVLFNPEGQVADNEFPIYLTTSFLNQNGIEYINPEGDRQH